LVIKLVIPDINSTEGGVFTEALPIRTNSIDVSDKARKNSKNFDELHSVSSPNNDNTTKSESETFGLVTGICYSRDKASAVINNKTIVYEGDAIDGVTIVKIYKDKVEFTKNGKNWVLPVTRKQTTPQIILEDKHNMSGPSTDSLVFRHTPSTMPISAIRKERGFLNTTLDLIRMLAEQENLKLVINRQDSDEGVEK